MALDSGRVKITDKFDASHPLRYGRFTIHDYHAKGRVLSVPEIFI
jgi:cell division protein FtsI (penicillin-binding protein 3)